MKDYLSLIRKSDFTDLFKFGYLFIDTKGVVAFDGDVYALPKNKEIRDEVFKRPNQFDYTYTVLLVHFRNDHIEEDGKINIEEVQNIFALDTEAKRTIEISYDTRIRIEDPIWLDAPQKLHEQFLYEDFKKGASNIWKILNIDEPLSEVESILPDNSLKEIAREVQNDKRPDGDLSFWVYLLRYERHGFFPKTTVGFFMDLINVYINAIQKREMPSESIETTGIYAILRQWEGKNYEMDALMKRLDKEMAGRNFFDKVNKLASQKVDAVKVAILFLKFREEFKVGFKHANNSNSIKENPSIKYGMKNFPQEINFALYLLGVFLGNSHTYECLYDAIPLPIFKCTAKKSDEKRSVVDIDDVDKYAETMVGTQGVFPGMETGVIQIPKKVRKPGSKRSRKVKNIQDYFKLQRQGYKDDLSEGYING